MAKASKMNRGVSSKQKNQGGMEVKYPEGVHMIDSMGNIFASIPELSRCVPSYFTMEQLTEAFNSQKLVSLSQEDLEVVADILRRKVG